MTNLSACLFNGMMTCEWHNHVLYNMLNGGVWRVKISMLKQCVFFSVYLHLQHSGRTQRKYAYTRVVQLFDYLPHWCNKSFTAHIVVHLFTLSTLFIFLVYPYIPSPPHILISPVFHLTLISISASTQY